MEFSVVPTKETDLHKPLTENEKENLANIFSIQSTSQVKHVVSIKFKNEWYQLKEIQPTTVYRRDEILIEERLDNSNYKDSMALYELIDFNRLQLSKCRRSDDILFNMLLPNNINQLTKSDFNNKYCDKHICFTNKKRIT